MNILRIDSSVRVEGSKTRALTDFFIEALKNNKAIDLIHRDVGLNIPEMPTNEFIVANYTPETDRTTEMREVLSASDSYISELRETEYIVIASPMYNFSISTPLKAYIDNIVRIGKTFGINEKGEMIGLLEGKKLLIITSRGAMSYETGELLHSFDFQENYLTAVFNFLGVTDISFVHTEAQDFGSEELKTQNIELSKQQLLTFAKSW